MDGDDEITKLRAAEYVCKSKEHQQYSAHNHSDNIREHSDKRGIKVINTYANGKNDLDWARATLKQLIAGCRVGRMLSRSIDKVVSKMQVSRAFDANLSTINSRINLLHGI